MVLLSDCMMYERQVFLAVQPGLQLLVLIKPCDTSHSDSFLSSLLIHKISATVTGHYVHVSEILYSSSHSRGHWPWRWLREAYLRLCKKNMSYVRLHSCLLRLLITNVEMSL